jgi:hypothetical protein
MILSLLLSLALSQPAATPAPGQYSDALSRCLLASSSESDRATLTRWVFAAMSAHPSVADLSRVSAAQRDAAARAGAALFERLITVDCRKETLATLKHEGREGFAASFQQFGTGSMRGLISHPAVATEMGRVTGRLIASPAFLQLIREAAAAGLN